VLKGTLFSDKLKTNQQAENLLPFSLCLIFWNELFS